LHSIQNIIEGPREIGGSGAWDVDLVLCEYLAFPDVRKMTFPSFRRSERDGDCFFGVGVNPSELFYVRIIFCLPELSLGDGQGG
jgi:hypothetical protein